MNLEALLAPLAGERECGEDMLFSDTFDRITEMRRFDDPSLSQGEWITEVKEADWRGVVAQCSQLLTTQTKDLRLAAWMTEALSSLHGFEGLADGYALTAELIERYWGAIHPQPEEGDQEQRIGVLDWLLAQSPRLVRQASLTDSPRGRFNAMDLASAQALEQAMERNPGEAESLKAQAHLTLEAFEAARRDTPGAFFAASAQSAHRALETLQTLESAVDSRLGMDGPSFAAARDALKEVIDQLGRYARDAGVHSPIEAVELPATVSAGQAEHTGSDTVLTAPGGMQGPIQSRAQAIAQLKAVADFFRRTEPHSPVAYLADKAAKWGDMSLHEWLRSVVKDDGALAHVEELLGVQPVSTASEQDY